MKNFPNLTHWWDYTKKDIMSCVYWSQHQIPPSDKKVYENEWQKLKEQLIKKHGRKQEV